MSYNTLHVPLSIGTWSCELVPASDYCSPSGKQLWFMEGDELEQLKDDRQTFDQYFRPNYDFRFLIRTEIDAISSFVRDHLNLAHWDLPTDNAGIERILRQSVKDGRMAPIVNRERRTPHCGGRSCQAVAVQHCSPYLMADCRRRSAARRRRANMRAVAAVMDRTGSALPL